MEEDKYKKILLPYFGGEICKKKFLYKERVDSKDTVQILLRKTY
jgi:hypothetical protein